MKETIGWIGVGSMGHRMSRHLVAAGYPVVVADAVSTAKAPEGATVAKSNGEVASRADVIILAHKPAQLDAIAAEIKGEAKAIISLLARTSLQRLRAAFPDQLTYLVKVPSHPLFELFFEGLPPPSCCRSRNSNRPCMPAPRRRWRLPRFRRIAR